MEKTGKIFQTLFLVFMMSFLPLRLLAADIKVKAQVDRNQLGIGELFVLNVSVESDDDFDMTEPRLPNINGIELINSAAGGYQSSSSMNIVNGKTEFVKKVYQDFNYQLSPQKEGVFVIPPVGVVVGGQTYRTNPIKIEVKDEYRNGAGGGQAQKKNSRTNPRFPPGFGGDDDDSNANALGAPQDAEDLFDQLLKQQMRAFGGGGAIGNPFGQQQRVPQEKLNINTNEAFFVYLDVDKTEVYEGEQITANWYIYTRANIESLDRAKFPDLKGFWKEIIEEVPALQFTDVMVNGVHYRKALLASHALFPIKAGTAVIDEFKIKAKVRMPTQFGFGGLHEFTKSSRRQPIKVLPLPEEGKTKSFSGAVGSYQISLTTEGTSFPANQPFLVKVRFEGTGNAKLIDLPNINWPEGLEVYDTKSESKFFKEGNSYKEFDILVIPHKVGEIKIPSFDLTYFDPAQKKYITQSTQELNLQITPGAALAGGSGDSSLVSQAKKNPQEASYKPQPILQLPQAGLSSLPRTWIYAGVLALGLMFLLTRFLWQLRQLNFEPEFLTAVNEKIKRVETFTANSDYRKVGSEATNLIYLLTAYLAGHKKADQEMHLMVKEISASDQGLYLSRINQLFDYFQLLGFSPDEVMRSVLQQKPLQNQVTELKNVAKEIVAKSKKEDNYNS